MKPKSLGTLEREVMEIVWQLKNCSVRQVVEHLRKKRRIAYTTVATIFERLYQKGLLDRRTNPVAYIYFPKLTKASYSKNMAQSFLKNFIKSFGDVAIASFAETVDQLPQDKKDYFLKLLNSYDKGK